MSKISTSIFKYRLTSRSIRIEKYFFLKLLNSLLYEKIKVSKVAVSIAINLYEVLFVKSKGTLNEYESSKKQPTSSNSFQNLIQTHQQSIYLHLCCNRSH